MSYSFFLSCRMSWFFSSSKSRARLSSNLLSTRSDNSFEESDSVELSFMAEVLGVSLFMEYGSGRILLYNRCQYVDRRIEIYCFFIRMQALTEIPFEQLLKNLNQVRQNPHLLIPLIQKQLQSFRNDHQYELAPRRYYRSFEGRYLWEETIEYLNQLTPARSLTGHKGLSLASRDHASDLARNGLLSGEFGTDGSDSGARIGRYCIGSGQIYEAVASEFLFEGRDHALQTIASMAISDGDPTRKNRKALFDGDFNYVGIHSEKGPTHFITVFNFATDNLALKEQATRSVLSDKAANLEEQKVGVEIGKKKKVSASVLSSKQNDGNRQNIAV